MASEFERAAQRKRLNDLEDADSANTSPNDALALAARWLEEHGDQQVVVVIQRPEGGVISFHSDSTYAQAVFLLEAAKLTFFLGRE